MQRFHRHHQPPSSSAATPVSDAYADFKRGKKRGNYNCGRCGLPKKGHVCQADGAAATADASPAPSSSSASVTKPSYSSVRQIQPRTPYSHLRRALSFDDIDEENVSRGGYVVDSPDPCIDDVVSPFEVESNTGGLPISCLWEVLSRLPPVELLATAGVCKGWREMVRRLWKAAEELKIRVPRNGQSAFFGSVLPKCSGLVRLSLRMERFVRILLQTFRSRTSDEQLVNGTEQSNLKLMKLLPRS